MIYFEHGWHRLMRKVEMGSIYRIEVICFKTLYNSAPYKRIEVV